MSDTVQFSGKKGKSHKLRNTLGIAALAIAIPITWAETTAEVSPTGLVAHYVTGDGQPITVDFTELDLGDVEKTQQYPTQALQNQAKYMKDHGIESQDVSYDFGYVLGEGDEFAVGGIDLNLSGVLVVEGSRWELKKPTLTGNKNYFAYYPADHRSWLAQAANWLGEQLPGTPYWINFEGSQPAPPLSGTVK